MLVETIDGDPNKLCTELGEGLLDALFDLLQRPAGPRIRDRLGHGECDLIDVPRNLAAVIISISFAVAARLSNQSLLQKSVWDDYRARFHPVNLLLKTCNDALDLTEKLATASERASAFMDTGNGSSNLMEDLVQILTAGAPIETARCSLNFQPATLFRPRQEIMTTVALLRTIRSLCVALEAARLEIEKRTAEVTEGRLRSRQRKTLERMVQGVPSVNTGCICLILMAAQIRDAVAENPDNLAKWQR